jgi:hypothetical protein
VSTLRWSISVVVAVVTLLVSAPSSLGRSTRQVHTLTVTAASVDTEHGVGDTGPAGLSKGDTYVSNATVRNRAGGRIVGSYHVSCVITDENDSRGNAWSGHPGFPWVLVLAG